MLAEDESDEEARDLYLGRTLSGRYRLIRQLGAGGMGAVYEAEHTDIGRRFAIKILHAQLANDVGVVRRFKNEARATGTLGHPHIARSVDFGRTDEGAPYIAMEFLEGADLGAALAGGTPLEVERARRITDEVADALGAAHAAGIVHRDIKPENIFLTRDDTVKVLDFGISKFTQSEASVATKAGSFMGSPYYMAPEQVRDASCADARTDVYALGAVLYEMLAGVRIFPAASLPMIIVAISQDEIRPLREHRPEVPQALSALTMRMLDKDPDARPQSMKEVRAALRGEGTASTPPVGDSVLGDSVPGAVVRPAPRMLPLGLFFGAVGLVAASVAGVLVFMGTAEPPPELLGPQPTVLPVSPIAVAESPPAAEQADAGLPLPTELPTGVDEEVPEAEQVSVPSPAPRRRAGRRADRHRPPNPTRPSPSRTEIDGVPIDDSY